MKTLFKAVYLLENSTIANLQYLDLILIVLCTTYILHGQGLKKKHFSMYQSKSCIHPHYYLFDVFQMKNQQQGEQRGNTKMEKTKRRRRMNSTIVISNNSHLNFTCTLQCMSRWASLLTAWSIYYAEYTYSVWSCTEG